MLNKKIAFGDNFERFSLVVYRKVFYTFLYHKKAIYSVLIGLCLLVYVNTLNNAFISDDVPAVLENPGISQASHFLLEPPSLFNSIAYLIAGYRPFIYHLISIILHAINTILVFIFLSLFFETSASFLGACLFAVHPIHTEAVTWISGKPYLFLALFILTTYLLYYRATNPKSDIKNFNLLTYSLALLVFSYSIIKTNYFLILFPLFLILADIALGKCRRNWLWWLPFIGIAVVRIIPALLVIPGRIAFVTNAINSEIVKNPFVYFVYSFYYHLGLLLFPEKLTLCHGTIVTTVSFYKSVILFIIPIVFLLVLALRKAKTLFLALGIFILFLVPTYSPLPFVSSVVAERYLYFNSISLSIAVAFIYDRYKNKSEIFKRCLLAVLVSVIILYGIRTIIRNRDWKTPERFWRKTLDISPGNVDARNNLAVIYLEKGEINKAIEEFEKVIRINPRYVGAYDNLAVAYMKMGDRGKAVSLWKKALEIDPNYAQADFNLSVAYFSLGEYGLAIKHCDEAVRLGYKIPPEFLKSLQPYRKE